MTGFLRLIMIGCAILALAAFYGAGSARRKRHHLSFAFALLVGLLLLSLTTLFATITVGISGYRAFTAEQVAATIKTEPIGPHHFRGPATLAALRAVPRRHRGLSRVPRGAGARDNKAGADRPAPLPGDRYSGRLEPE